MKIPWSHALIGAPEAPHIHSLGLTPQAMDLSPLRGSRSIDNFSSGLDRSESGRSAGLAS